MPAPASDQSFPTPHAPSANRHSKSRVLRWLTGNAGVPWGSNPADYDPQAVEHTVRFFGGLFGTERSPRRYFPLEVRGMERIPAAPVLIVSNHSGGTTIPDVWGFLVSWYRHFGVHRPIHPLAHEMIVSTRLVGPYFAARGILRATRALTLHTLTAFGHDVMVMPGGDLETWRPYRQRYQVDFNGRTGYASMAIEARVPIVPVAHAGAHNTLMVLSNGRWLARLLRLQHIARANVWPIHLSLPWGLGIGPLPHLPLPAVLRYRIGEPIVPPPPPEDGRPTREQIDALDLEVRTSIQRMLTELHDSAIT